MANAKRPAVTVPSREGMSALRCSFVHLGHPYASKQGDAPKYQLTCMFNKQDPVDCAAIQQLAQDLEACRIEQWPNPQTRPMLPIVASQPGQGPKSPIKDGDVAADANGRPIKEKNPEYAGHYIVACSSKNPVSVIGPNMEQIDANGCRSGYWYKVNMNVYAYDNNGGGVTLGLNGAQLMREDIVLGGGGPPVDQMFMASGGQDPNMYGGGAQPGQQPAPQFPQPNQVTAPQQQPQPQAQPQPQGQAPTFQAPQFDPNMYGAQPNIQQPGQQPNQAYPGGAEQPGQAAPLQQPTPLLQPGQVYPGGAEQYVQQPAQQQPVYQAPGIQQPGQAGPAPQQPLQQPGSIV